MRTAVLLLLLAMPATAADPFVKVAVSPKDGAWVGERVTLSITLGTPDFFAGVPSFDIPPISGVIVVPPSGSPLIGSERIGEATFTTQVHDFALYAQRPGTVTIPAFSIRFDSNAGFGQPTVQRKVTTEPISFPAKTPPGAEGLGTVIAAEDLQVVNRWEPEHDTAKVGDAFTITQTITASGVPGMVLPPLQIAPIDGIAIYPKEPTVADATDRGDLTGKRIDTVTMVCERPGTVTIPNRTLTWFDLKSKTLKTERMPGRTLRIQAEPTTAETTPASDSSPTSSTNYDRRTIAIYVVVAGLGLVLLILRIRMRNVRSTQEDGESVYFGLLHEACRSGDPHAVYTALIAWLDRFGPMTLASFLTQAEDDRLDDAVLKLRSRLYSRECEPGPWSESQSFWQNLTSARHRLLRNRQTTATGHPLPPLNPAA